MSRPDGADRTRTWRDNPWWIPPFLGTVPDIEPRLLKLIGLVSLALFFEQYDLSMLTSALKYIAEDLGMREESLGSYLSIVRLGAIPAFLVIPFADRFGRRRVFLASLMGISLGTFLTGFSQTSLQFVVLQMMTRTFMVTCAAVAVVIVTEEFPAEHRGWAIGMVGALSACGYGLGAAIFSAVEVLPYGWRSLYMVGAIPFLLFPAFRAGVAETDRFRKHERERAASDGAGIASWVRPLGGLARAYPGRALGIGMVGALSSAGMASVFQFTGYYTLGELQWTPGQFSTMVILGGGVGIIGNVVAGRLGDTLGRRFVGLGFLAVFPLAAAAFYQGAGWMVPVSFIFIVFCSTAVQVITRALSTELFPTSQRGTASGWLAFVETLGSAAGLAILGAGTSGRGDIAFMTTALSSAVLIAGLFLLLLPETRRRELEAISQERAA